MGQLRSVLQIPAIVCVLIFSPLILVDASAHHGKPAKLYICKLVASTQMNGTYSGGDGTPEGGQFFGEFVEEFKYGETIRMTIHGGKTDGGFIQIDDPFHGEFGGPIITGSSYVSLPYAPYEQDEIGSQFNTFAIAVRYKFSYIINFYRSVLRYTRLGNHPTKEMDSIRHVFADCKYIGEE